MIKDFYIGYDRREDLVYKVAKHSLLRHTPGAWVHALVQDKLRADGVYERQPDHLASTDFSLTRFLVPHLARTGWAVFCDCDVLFTRDIIRELAPLLKREVPLYVVKHDYQPRSSVKMDGKQQHSYPRKNWSSFMVFNCSHPANKVLTPQVINKTAPSWLHQLGWLEGYEIGELPRSFNFLVGEYEPVPDLPTVLHYTLGIGVFDLLSNDYAAEWQAELDLYLKDQQSCGTS